MLPSRDRVSSARSGIQLDPERLRDGVQERPLGVGDLVRPLVRPDPGHGGGQLGDRVVVVAERAVAGLAVGDQVEPGHPLLGSLHQIEPQVVVHGQREPADLADRLGAALQQIGPVLHHPDRAFRATGLLVGGEDHPDRPTGGPPRAGTVPDDAQQHGVEVLHVDSAATPDAVVGDLGGERRHGPVGGVGRYHVEVAVDQQRAQARIGARRAPSAPPATSVRARTRPARRRCRPRRVAPPRARRPPAPPVRDRGRSWRCRSGSGRGGCRRPRYR